MGTKAAPWGFGLSAALLSAGDAFVPRLGFAWGIILALAPPLQNPKSRHAASLGARCDWPVSIRTIYGGSTKWDDPKNGSYQIVHEFDFLFTDQGELYFALAIFGQEFVVNMVGPSLEGWETWLRANDERSPLHCGKNTGVNTRLPGKFEPIEPLRDLLFFTNWIQKGAGS